MIALSEIFNGNNEYYGECYKAVEEKGKTKKKKLTAVRQGEPPFHQHLNKQTKIGLFPFTDARSVGFGAIDIDDYNCNHKGIIEKLKEFNIRASVAKSTNGGCHIYFLFDKPELASNVRWRLEDIATAIGYDGAEVFPKQDNFNPRPTKKGFTGLGNFIYIPGGNIPGMNDVSCFLDDNGEPIPEERATDFVLRKKVGKEWLRNVPHKPKIEKTTPPPIAAAVDANEMPNWPPCMVNIYTNGVKEGGRNNAVFNYAVLVKRAKGKVKEEDLKPFLATLKPPFEDDLERVLEQVNDNDYFFKCKDNPIKEHCNKEICKTKLLGLGGAAKEDIKKYPYIYIDEKDLLIDDRTGRPYKPDHFKRILASRRITDNEDKIIRTVESYISNRATPRCFDKELNPLKERRFKDEYGRTIYNTYRKPPVEPEDYTKEEIAEWLKLFEDLIPNSEYRHIIHQWIGTVITKPGTKIKWAPLFITPQGRGKDLIARGIKAAIGKDYFIPVDMKLLKQDQNSFLEDKLFCMFSETKEVKDKAEVNEVVKIYISDPELKIRHFHNQAYWVPNVCNFMFGSNHKSAMGLTDDSRRIMVLIDDKPRRERAWYAPIWELVEKHPGKILKFYQDYDYTGFNPADNAIETEFMEEVIEATTQHQKVILDILYEEGIFPFQKNNPYVNIPHLAAAIKKVRGDHKTNEVVIKQWLQNKKKMGLAKDLTDITWLNSGTGISEKPMIWTLSPDTHHETDRQKLRECYLKPNIDGGFDRWKETPVAPSYVEEVPF